MRILVGILIVICAITIGFIKSSEVTGRYNVVTRFFAGLGAIDEINTILGLEHEAIILNKGQQYHQAIAIYDEIINGTWHNKGQDTKQTTEEVISKAYLKKIDILKKLNQHDAIPAVVDAHLIRFKNSSNIKIQRYIAQAYLEKIVAFTEQNKTPQEILTVCDDMTKYFGVNDFPKMDPFNIADPNFSKHYNQRGARYFVETMMLYEIIQLEKMDNYERAQTQKNKLTQLLSPINSDGFSPLQKFKQVSNVTDKMIEYLGTSQEDSVQNIISTTLLDLGNAEVSQGKSRAAKNTFTKIVDLYRNSSNLEVQIRVHMAIYELEKLAEK